jgi:hypothetical protein
MAPFLGAAAANALIAAKKFADNRDQVSGILAILPMSSPSTNKASSSPADAD